MAQEQAPDVPALAQLRRIVDELTQARVAKLIGCTQQALSQWLLRKARPLTKSKRAMAKKLGIAESGWSSPEELAAAPERGAA